MDIKTTIQSVHTHTQIRPNSGKKAGLTYNVGKFPH